MCGNNLDTLASFNNKDDVLSNSISFCGDKTILRPFWGISYTGKTDVFFIYNYAPDNLRFRYNMINGVPFYLHNSKSIL